MDMNPLSAATTVSSTFTIQIDAIDTISISSSSISLTINSATAGSAPAAATNTSSTYAITTNGTNRRVYASIDSNIATTGLALNIQLAAPTGATSSGVVTMSTTAQNLVTGISNQYQSGMLISYTLNCTINTPPTSASRTVTYTLGP